MSLTESDLISSLLTSPSYIEQITSEMLPDDTADLLVKSGRKGKSDVKQLEHIVGISDLMTRQKAKKLREKAVITQKQFQLQRTMFAFGIYLRKFMTQRLDKDDVTLDTHHFGKFSLVDDPDADEESLYPKKLVYEPSSFMSKCITRTTQNNNQHHSMASDSVRTPRLGQLVKAIDYGQMNRLVRSQNQSLIKRNLDHLANHLVSTIILGNSKESDAKFSGRTMRINLRIGTLVASKNCLEFEPFPLAQIVADSNEQRDDMISKVSSMSKISYFKNRTASISQMQKDRKSQAFNNFLESSPDSRSKIPALSSILKTALPAVKESQEFGIQVRVNPITGNIQHFKQISEWETQKIDRAGSPALEQQLSQQSPVDFKPVELANLNADKIKIRNAKLSQRVQNGVFERRNIQEQVGIAKLIAGVTGKKNNIEGQFQELISNYDAVSQMGGYSGGATRSQSVMRPTRTSKGSGSHQRAASLEGILKGDENQHDQVSQSTYKLPSMRSNKLELNQLKHPNQRQQSLYEVKSNTTRLLYDSVDKQRKASQGGSRYKQLDGAISSQYQSNPLLKTAARKTPGGTKMLSNLTQKQYLEMKDSQMLPNPSQQFVQQQAIERLQMRMNKLNLDNSKQHNSMLQNVQAMEQNEWSQNEMQRRHNVQNQKYLRMQMNQKQEHDKFSSQERKQQVNEFEHSAAQESPEHARRVLEYYKKNKMDIYNQHAQHSDANKQFKLLSKQNDRAVQQVRDTEKANEVQEELMMINQKKKQMQEMNRQVWMDQIALNRMHKKLNL